MDINTYPTGQQGADAAFIAYCLGFYGAADPEQPGRPGLYAADLPGGPMTAEEIAAAVPEVQDELWSDGDSFDRERLRDRVLYARGIPAEGLEYPPAA